MKIFSFSKTIYTIFLIFIIFSSNVDKIQANYFTDVSNYATEAYDALEQKIIEGTSGYKDLFNSIYELINILKNNIDEKVTDSSRLLKVLNDMVKNIVKSTIGDSEAKEEEDKFSFTRIFDFSSFFSNSKTETKYFVDGLFEGVSSVPFAENKCYLEIGNEIDEINKTFETFLESCKNSDNVLGGVINLYNLLNKLKDLPLINCGFAGFFFSYWIRKTNL